MTPDALLEAQERTLYAIAKIDLSVSGDSTLDELHAQYQALRVQMSEWLGDGGAEPRWDRWPVAARAYTRSTR